METSGGKFPGDESEPHITIETVEATDVVGMGPELILLNSSGVEKRLIDRLEVLSRRSEALDRKMALDLRGTWVDSAGLGSLVKINSSARELEGVELTLILGNNKPLHDILDTTGTIGLFSIELPENESDNPTLDNPQTE